MDDGVDEEDFIIVEVGRDLENLPDGWICMKKVVIVEEEVFDVEERCSHMAQEHCAKVKTPNFTPKEVRLPTVLSIIPLLLLTFSVTLYLPYVRYRVFQ